ncbi:MAG: hypothetical protein WCV73_04815 [Patescibacteria group bacterium]|jgi:flagellar basal body-associated protein FliL
MLKLKINLKIIYSAIILLLAAMCFIIAWSSFQKYKNSQELSGKIQNMLEYVSLDQIDTTKGTELINSFSATTTPSLKISTDPFKTFIKDETTVATSTGI